MDDWPREPEDQERSWEGAQPPPRSGNLPEPPRNQPRTPRRNPQPGNPQPGNPQPGNQARGGEARGGEARGGELANRLNPPTGRQTSGRQPGRGVPPGSSARLPRPNADSVRGRLPDELRSGHPANRAAGYPDDRAADRYPDAPRADPHSVPHADPDSTPQADPRADRRAPSPGATRRVPPGATRRTGQPAGVPRRGATQRPSPDSPDATRVNRAEAADPLDHNDDPGDEPPTRDRNRTGGTGGGGRPPRRRMSRGTRIALNTGKVLVALAAVVALGATGVSWAELQTAENGITHDNVITPGGSSNNDQTHSDGADDILLVGLDSRTDVQGNALPPQVLSTLDAGDDSGEVDTDTMILLHIPDNGSQAVGISIPRDSWVSIPGYSTNKINAAYGDAKATSTKSLKAGGDTDAADIERQSSQAGAKELITVVQNLTGVHIDHYAEVNLYGFDQLSQAIGGVPVCLNHAVNDSLSGAHFPAGYFNVEGVSALQFVRQRHNIPGGSTDLQREARQQAFLASMAHKVLSAGTLTDPSELNNLITAIQKSIIIDSGWNLVDFASQMAGMSSGNIKFETVPVVNIDYWPSGKPNVGTNAVEVNPAQIAAFVQGATGNGTPPPSNVGATSSPSSTGAPASTGNAATTVDVQNGSGVHNLAAEVLSKLTKSGFAQGTAGNIANRTTSVIYFHAGQQDAANAVAAALGGKVTVAQGPSVPSGHVWVYLGSHYSSEGISAAADTWSIQGVNQTVVPQSFTPHQADPSSISDSGDTPPCVD